MILINGCSFTSGQGLYDSSCVYSVDYCKLYTLPFNNIAVAGSSNDYIRATTISKLLTSDYKFVMVNWTTPRRFTFAASMAGYPPMRILPNHSFNGIPGDTTQYNFEGGTRGLVKFWDTFADPFYFARVYFESVYLLQEFCKSRGIRYVFTNTNNYLQVDAWRKISDVLKVGNDHPETYINYFTGYAHSLYTESYNRLYKKNLTEDIRALFSHITPYVDNIDWGRFVGLNETEKVFFDPIQKNWPTEEDNAHPGREAHEYYRSLLEQTSWLTQEINTLYNTD